MSELNDFLFCNVGSPTTAIRQVVNCYKRSRTKGIISHGKRPSDIDSNASAPDDDLEIKHTTQEEESKPKRQKTGENEVKYACN